MRAIFAAAARTEPWGGSGVSRCRPDRLGDRNGAIEDDGLGGIDGTKERFEHDARSIETELRLWFGGRRDRRKRESWTGEEGSIRVFEMWRRDRRRGW